MTDQELLDGLHAVVTTAVRDAKEFEGRFKRAYELHRELDEMCKASGGSGTEDYELRRWAAATLGVGGYSPAEKFALEASRRADCLIRKWLATRIEGVKQ